MIKSSDEKDKELMQFAEKLARSSTPRLDRALQDWIDQTKENYGQLTPSNIYWDQ